FPASYRERYPVAEALIDLGEVDRLGDGVCVRAFREAGDTPLQFRFKLYSRGTFVPLADVLPILEHMGLKALEQFGHVLHPAGGEPIYVDEYLLEDPRGEQLSFADVKTPFETTFAAAWAGQTESDGFNRLVLELGVGWREAALIRALARYRQQTGM